MNIYYSFNDFMNQVIEKADALSRQNHNRGLEELFDVSRSTYESMEKLIGAGWYVFLAVAALLALSLIGFTAALVGFLTTPIGLAVAAIFGLTAGKKIKQMYQEKILPLTVKEVGEQYKIRWENANGNRTVIDGLLNQAANDLYQRAAARGISALLN